MAASAESLATLADVSLIPAVSVTITTGQQLVTILSKDPAAVLELVVGPPADTSNEESDEKKRAWFLGHIVIFGWCLVLCLHSFPFFLSLSLALSPPPILLTPFTLPLTQLHPPPQWER